MEIRTSKPSNNKYYIRKSNGGYNGAIQGKPVSADANVLSNCVGYANGRFHEIIGENNCKYELTCNAENFIERAKSKNLKIVKEPTVGGIMVFQKGTLSSSDGVGHVMVVEKYINPTQILTSESSYGSKAFYNATRNNSNGNWGMSSSYKYRGCIVNPAIGEVRYNPEKKSNEEIAQEVINGLWGNNPERKQKLEEAGYDYNAIQAIVNEKSKKDTPAITKGCKVKFIGTKTYSGNITLASWTHGYIFNVIEVSGDRVVIGQGTQVTAAVNIRDCQKV